MTRFPVRSMILACVLLVEVVACAQKAPPVPDRAWDVPPGRQQFQLPGRAAGAFVPEPAKVYNLAELVDIAEQNNPETRVSWLNAKARAADLGIAKAALYPTLAAVALAQSARQNVFFAPNFYRQTTGTFAPTVSLDYIVFDFGRRSQEIAISADNLLAADFAFNDTHRQVIFGVARAYYRFLDSRGREDAAEANLKNAETVQEAAEARLQNGLITLPDVLEARSAAAQADYDLQAALGATEIAHGDLATAMGISPTRPFLVESLEHTTMPQAIGDTVETSIDRALGQRPDLMSRVARLRAAGAEVKLAQRAYTPTLSFDGSAGLARFYGEQDQMSGIYSHTQEAWNARLTLSWTLFDGWAREQRLVRAKDNQKQVAAEVDAVRDEVENEVWTAYSNARTALRQQRAAAALLTASTESYNAALESYNYGVRSQIDVVSAQRGLAQARTADVSARAGLLTAMAALAFQTGDLLRAKGP